MTTITPSRATSRSIRLTQTRVAYSEWIKLRSLRSTWWTLSIFIVSTIGIGILLSSIAAAHVRAGHHLQFSPVTLSLYGAYLAPLTIGVLGALVATGEYMTGMIRASLTAVPTRLPVLWAKIGVLAAVGLILSELAVFVTFWIGMLILGHAGASLGQPGVLRAVAGTGLYLMLTGLFGVAIGAVVRNTAVAISALAGIMLVLPVLTNLLPATWTVHFARYLPSTAGQAILAVQHSAGSGLLPPWNGLALFAGYIAVIVAGAAILLKRRDA